VRADDPSDPGARGFAIRAIRAFVLADGRAAGRAVIDGRSIPERTASLGSVHTMVVLIADLGRALGSARSTAPAREAATPAIGR
jgi:hypothetical protein